MKRIISVIVALVAMATCTKVMAADEAYAVYDSTNGTLTFYYDSDKSSRTGAVFGMNTETDNPGWYDNRTQITKVVFESSFRNARPTSTNCWFYNMGNLTSITGLQYLNTSEVTRFRYMFVRCSQLTSLDLSSFDTRKATSMAGMFNGCSALTTIYVGSLWNTSNVTASSMMFTGCTALVGGAGTTFDANHVDKEYARIDGGTSSPGYLTVQTYDLKIAGTTVTSMNKDDVLGNGKVSYDISTQTLTLNNATIKNSTANTSGTEVSEKCGLYIGMNNLTIDAMGYNTIESTNYIGLYFKSNVTIKGSSGSLNLKGKTAGLSGVYARSGTLTVEGGVQLTAEGTGTNSYGIEGAYANNGYYKRMVVNGAKTVVQAKGTACSIGKLAVLVLNDELAITAPTDASFTDHAVKVNNENVKGDWVIISHPAYGSYGFQIGAWIVNSNNYESLNAGENWSYDPQENVLHLNGGTIDVHGGYSALTVYGDINPTLNICVHGDNTFSDAFENGIVIQGNGTHTIYGDGTLNITSRVVQSTILSATGSPSLTIKDIDVNLKTYDGVGISSSQFREFILDYCKMNINTGAGIGWIYSKGSAIPQLKSCALDAANSDAAGSFNVDGLHANGNYQTLYAQNPKINRLVKYVNLSVPVPCIGDLVLNSADIASSPEAGTVFDINMVYWYKIVGDDVYPLADGQVFQEGNVYRVIVVLKRKDVGFSAPEDIVARVNEDMATNVSSGSETLYVSYDFAPVSPIVTGIDGVSKVQAEDRLPLYNLQGQRVSHPVKGQIYVQNGKKVLMR